MSSTNAMVISKGLGAVLPMDGKTALVTGASSGIGWAIAKRFADDGARVYLTGRRTDELEAAAKDMGPNAVPVPSDVSRAADLDRVMDVIRGDGRQLDVVVANAGLGDGARLADVTEEQFDHVFGVNTKGSLLTVQKSLPLLTDAASVILLASSSMHQGGDRMGVYAASKAAVRSLGRTWAAELAPRGVRVNVITPGPIATPAIDRVAAGSAWVPKTSTACWPRTSHWGAWAAPRKSRRWPPSWPGRRAPSSPAPSTSSTAERSRSDRPRCRPPRPRGGRHRETSKGTAP